MTTAPTVLALLLAGTPVVPFSPSSPPGPSASAPAATSAPAAAPTPAPPIAPPVAPRHEHVQTWHGQTVNDPWFWLREKASPEVRAYLEAENAYTQAMTAPIAPFASALYDEMLGRIQQTDLSVPWRRGGFCHYRRTVEGLQYAIQARRPVEKDGSCGTSTPEQVLLDLGVIFAIAHVRGGDEMGEAWHDDGMLLRKWNTFHDFEDVAEFLVKERWTSPDRLLAEGGSAGGLLMGVVVNDRPDLFRAVHAAVPFVDVMNTMMDATLPLTVGEYLEWGNPNEKPAFDYMRSYSPYDNVAARDHPALLVTTSFNDSQVMYWEPAKWVAKLRATGTGTRPLLLKTKLEAAGHGGASGRYDALRDRAFEVAWMLSQVGITR